MVDDGENKPKTKAKEKKVIDFPDNLSKNKKRPPQDISKKNLRVGIVTGLFIFLIYMFQGEIFRKSVVHDKSSDGEVSLLDLGFSPFISGEVLPPGKLKFYTKNDAGDWIFAEKTLKEFSGKPMIVHLWATFCGPCVKELPAYDSFVANQDKVQNIALVIGKSDVKDIEKFYQQKGIKNLQIVVDEKNTLPQWYKIQGIPTTLFVSAAGKPLGYVLGPISWGDETSKDLIFKLLNVQS